MKNYTDEQFNKLPKWAQAEINRLEANNKSFKQRLDEITGVSETNTYIVEGISKKPLGNNEQIEFELGEKKLNKVRVYINRHGVIDVNSDSRLGHDMIIKPRAANSFYITFTEK